MSWRGMVLRLLSRNVILACGWVTFLLYAYPGYMSADSAQQLLQARRGEALTDWHPPLMAFVWRYLDKLIAGPFLMLVVQSLAFLLGTYALMRRMMSERVAAVVASCFLVLPYNLLVMSVIWKDSQMAGLLVAAIPALLSKRRGWRLAGYALVFVATGMRYNAAAATFPLLVALFDLENRLVWWKRYAAASGLWIALTAGALLFNRVITQTQVHPWPVGSASVDIAGIMRFAHDADLDQIVRETPDVPWKVTTNVREHIRRYYHPENSFNHEFEGESGLFHYPANPMQRDAIGTLFWRLATRYPGAYVWHRKRVLMANLHGDPFVWNAFVPFKESEALLEHQAHYSSAQRFISDILIRLTRAHLLRAFPFCVASLILIWLTRRQRLAFALFASGLAHEFGVFALAPSVDFRYSHWMVVATILGTIVLFMQRYRSAVESTA